MTKLPKKNPQTILLATDFSKPASRAFRYAITLASTLRVGIIIVHVIKAIPGPGHEMPVSSRYLDPLRTQALLDLRHLARIALDAGICAQSQLVYGQPAGSILQASTKMHAGLIILGTHGRTGWDRLEFGSIAERIVREAL